VLRRRRQVLRRRRRRGRRRVDGLRLHDLDHVDHFLGQARDEGIGQQHVHDDDDDQAGRVLAWVALRFSKIHSKYLQTTLVGALRLFLRAAARLRCEVANYSVIPLARVCGVLPNF